MVTAQVPSYPFSICSGAPCVGPGWVTFRGSREPAQLSCSLGQCCAVPSCPFASRGRPIYHTPETLWFSCNFSVHPPTPGEGFVSSPPLPPHFHQERDCGYSQPQVTQGSPSWLSSPPISRGSHAQVTLLPPKSPAQGPRSLLRALHQALGQVRAGRPRGAPLCQVCHPIRKPTCHSSLKGWADSER